MDEPGVPVGDDGIDWSVPLGGWADSQSQYVEGGQTNQESRLVDRLYG